VLPAADGAKAAQTDAARAAPSERGAYAAPRKRQRGVEFGEVPNVKQAVPFFAVSNMEASIRFYVDGLGFEMTNKWIVEGKLRWCWLQNGGAALMLQEFRKDLDGKAGVGVQICFTCEDALAIYRDITSREIEAARPFVGNSMWVTELTDPDGYRIAFESYTDAPEESKFSG
jgi:catechol 2,3-dioxygenase-like lactoylglutathione lyase family enzyme